MLRTCTTGIALSPLMSSDKQEQDNWKTIHISLLTAARNPSWLSTKISGHTSIPKANKILILRAFNPLVGRDHETLPAFGKYGLRKMNINGFTSSFSLTLNSSSATPFHVRRMPIRLLGRTQDPNMGIYCRLHDHSWTDLQGPVVWKAFKSLTICRTKLKRFWNCVAQSPFSCIHFGYLAMKLG
jgi:hypothetical protein